LFKNHSLHYVEKIGR